MNAPRNVATPGTRALLAFLFPSLCTAVLRGQPPPLAPTDDVTIVVPNGPLHYSSILVPAGVTVRFVAPGGGSGSIPGRPAVVLCDGDAIVHGTLWLGGDYASTNDRPAGWVTTGAGSPGVTCGSVVSSPPGGGRHAGTYGSVLPFSLEGGSKGGTVGYMDPGCNQLLSFSPGGGGGGTLVLLAGGRIDAHGRVSASGASGLSGGSGGSILLRGDAGVTVLPGGWVDAFAGLGFPPPPSWPLTFSDGAHGFVRLDAWGASPVIQGTVVPTPTVLELPHLRALSPPAIGTMWNFDVFAPDTAWVYVAASLVPGTGAPTPFGPLGLDLATTAGIAQAFPQASHDPVASMSWPIPNAPALVGLPLWVQAIALPPNLPARLTNTLAVVVQ
jgi:hypothetical protein